MNRTVLKNRQLILLLPLLARAIRMRMYAKQKLEAQKQLEDPTCEMIYLTLDIECRLVSK
jgi:hypothetical protein